MNTLNADAALNLKDGSDYTGSTSIGSEITALETLLNSTDSDNAADRVTDFFKLHNGTDKRDIDDLADLNVQITNSIVTRDIGVSDASAQTVKLTTAEVDRLGEGGVQIKATQTDGVGNLHEGDPATKSFVIDTVKLKLRLLTISQVSRLMVRHCAYTLTFTGVQSVAESDLTLLVRRLTLLFTQLAIIQRRECDG